MSGSGATPAGGQIDLALFEIASQRIGVPIAHVVQAAQKPAHITRLARNNSAIEGVFMQRGKAVPLINLHPLLQGGGSADIENCYSVTLQSQGKLVAIYVDQVLGLTKVDGNAVRRVYHDDDTTEFFHSVALEQGGELPLSLLDPARLATQARVWANSSDDEHAVASADQARQSAERASSSFVIIKVGATQLGFPAADVGEVMADLQVQKMGQVSAGFLGMAKWRGNDVPVWDFHQQLGLASSDAGLSRAGYLVLKSAKACAAFPVTAFVAVQSIAQSEMQSVSESGAEWSRCSLGTFLDHQQERVLLMETGRMLSNVPLSGLQRAALVHRLSDPGGNASKASSATSAYIVVKSGQEWALPMHALCEIMRLPDSMSHDFKIGSATLGYMEWRGSSIELLDLLYMRQKRNSAVGDEARVVIVEIGTRTLALLVEGVLALIPAHAGQRSRYAALGKVVHMVSYTSGSTQASYEIFDFEKLELPVRTD